MSERAGTNAMDDLTLEEALEIHFAAEPAPKFLAALEERLMAEQASRERTTAAGEEPAAAAPPSLWQWLAGVLRPRPVVVAFVLLLLLLVPLLVIGPRKAWAGLQAWLGYVPGVGFVDLEENRLLVNPTSMTREGVTLRVEQVIVGPEDTVVVIDSEGLPPREQLWPDGREPFDDFQAWLRLPDGDTLAATGRTMRVGGASLVFPALPPDVYRVTLELPRLPLVPAGAAPENWVVPLVLQPASGEVVAQMYPQPYRPQEAVESHQGVTLRVLEVAHHPQETAVRMQLDWENAEWENHFGPARFQLPYLRDNEGNRYELIPGSTTGSQVAREVRPAAPEDPTPPPNRWVGSETFEPVPPTVEELTLVVDGVDFDIPASGGFTVDLGDSPQIGDAWDLDVTLDVAGFAVHVTGAELVEEEMRLREGIVRQTVLRFDVDPVPEQGNRRLFGLFLEAPGSAFQGGSTGFTTATNKIRTGLELDEGTPLPTGQIDVHLRGANLLVRGPWELTWPVPRATNGIQEDNRLPETYAPRDALDTAGGVTLQALAAAHTERETAVLAQGRWEDSFWEWRGFDGAGVEGAPLLSDEDGRVYEAISAPPHPLRVELEVIDPSVTPTPPPPGAAREDTAWFEPLAASAERLTLQVNRLWFSAEPSGAFALDLGAGPQFGARWALDVALEIGGFALHVSGVRLEEGAEDVPFKLVFETTVEQGDRRRLEGVNLGLARDGTDFGGAYHSATTHFSRAGKLEPTISLAALPASPFTVVVDGATMAVDGPWTLSWEVPEDET